MGNKEKPEGKYYATHVVLAPADTSTAAAEAGTLKQSGSKLWFDNGTTWELVTSA